MNENKWHLAKDMLPGGDGVMCEHDAVLVFSNFNLQLFGIARYVNGCWEILGDEGAHNCTGFYAMSSEDITHWKYFDFPENAE